MKRFFTAILVFSASLSLAAQTSPSQFDVIELAEPTALGVPEGNPTSLEIGAAGGSLVSDDGRVTLIFPEGALAQDTNIRIQPTTNPAPNGVGKAYWFEPSGIRFEKPVQIIFRYTDEEADICPPDFMSLGLQDRSGRWTTFDYDRFDTASKTLTGFIHHFSGATNINDVELLPRVWDIPVGAKTGIEVVDITRPQRPGDFDFALIDRNDPILWHANGVLRGNDQTGTLTEFAFGIGKEKIVAADYRAPSILPRQNPVRISADIYRKTRKGKKLRVRLTTWVGVYDVYQISLTHEFTSRGGLDSELRDEASAIVWVDPAHKVPITLTDLKNHPPSVIKEGSNGPFREKIFVEDALGSIHLTEGFANARISKDHPPEVYFEPFATTVLTYKFQHSARGTKSDIEPIMDRTVVEEINFIANGKEQRYNISTGKGEKYRLVVTPYRKEKPN